MRVLIVGCGYVGLALGRRLADAGHLVWGARRAADTAGALSSHGIRPLLGDVTQPETLTGWPTGFDWAVYSVSASERGLEGYRQAYIEGLHHVLSWLAARPPTKLVYTSSTSVYGQQDGSAVNEASPAEPASETAAILLQAEALVLAAARAGQVPGVVLRVAGIYGPGRGYWLKQFLNGEARLESDGERILNMIHREDVAGAILAALARGRPGAIYNAVDNEPVSQLGLFQWLTAQTGREVPPRASAGLAPERKRGVTSKRVMNQKLRAELGYVLVYPTFREGFAAQLGRTNS